MLVPAFVLAVGITAISGVWILQRYGVTLQPMIKNALSPLREVAVPFTNVFGTQDTDAYKLDVSLIYQKPELINGCEATSLTMLLRYYGYSIDKSILAYDYIPREDFSAIDGARYGSHPGTAYPGDPATRKGFYCYPKPIVTGANKFLSEQGTPLLAYDISGSSEQDFAQHLRDGNPIMVWATLDYGSQLTYGNFTWQLLDGKTYTPYSNLHCVVLVGVDDTCYQVCDPLNGYMDVNRASFIDSYQALGSMAVVIK